jgi:hypothetical protein
MVNFGNVVNKETAKLVKLVKATKRKENPQTKDGRRKGRRRELGLLLRCIVYSYLGFLMNEVGFLFF